MEENIVGSVGVPSAGNAEEKTAQQRVPSQTLPIDQSIEYAVIHNETDAFIGIESTEINTPDLIIAPFGSRTLDRSLLEKYSTLHWAEQKLISIEILGTNQDSSGYRNAGLWMIAFVAFLVIGIPVNWIFEVMRWGTFWIVALLLIILTVISFIVAERREKAQREGRKIGRNISGWLKLIPGMIFVLATGLTLPFVAVYFFGDGKALLQAPLQLPAFGRLAQVSFIALASILPALFFYLFERQQVDIQKENFYKEVMSLDPNVHSLTEARTKFEALIDSVYGSGNAPLSILLLFISTTLLVMGWIITMGTLDASDAAPTMLADFFIPTRTAFTFGVLGAYFFSLNMIFRRYVRADLTPKTYAHITVRLLVTMVLVWAVSNLPQFGTKSLGETTLFAVAFVIGVIPETGLTLIQDYVRRLTKIGNKEEEVLSLNKLEGIHLYDRARLLEEGIENIENLAHHNMIELIARTRIPAPRLVDLFDQAILYLHLGLQDEENRKFFTLLRSHGIRTATDLDVALGVQSAREGLQNIAPPQTLEKMEVIFQALFDDEWYDHLVNWRLNRPKRKKPITDPYVFYSMSKEQIAQQGTPATNELPE